MNIVSRALAAVGALIISASLTLPAQADVPGAHPAYLHALSDLRFARALISQPAEWNVAMHQRRAVEAIDRAIGDIKHASYDDGKDLDEHPPVDVSRPRIGRLHESIRSLEHALNDLERNEQDGAALPWRADAIRDVHFAREQAVRALRDNIADHE